MDKLDPLRNVGVDIDNLSPPMRSALDELSEEEVRVLAKIQKSASDAGVGSPQMSGGGAGGAGSCIY